MNALGKDPVTPKYDVIPAFGLKRVATSEPVLSLVADEETPAFSDPEIAESAAPAPVVAEPVQPVAPAQPEYQAPVVQPDSGKADKGLTLRMSRSLFQRFRERKERDGLSYPNLMFTAVSKTHKRLPELFATSTIDLSHDADNLFELPTAVSKLNDQVREATDDLTIRVTAHNIKVLDTLKETYNAPSRNHLINTCVQAYLDETE